MAQIKPSLTVGYCPELNVTRFARNRTLPKTLNLTIRVCTHIIVCLKGGPVAAVETRKKNHEARNSSCI